MGDMEEILQGPDKVLTLELSSIFLRVDMYNYDTFSNMFSYFFAIYFQGFLFFLLFSNLKNVAKRAYTLGKCKQMNVLVVYDDWSVHALRLFRWSSACEFESA